MPDHLRPRSTLPTYAVTLSLLTEATRKARTLMTNTALTARNADLEHVFTILASHRTRQQLHLAHLHPAPRQRPNVTVEISLNVLGDLLWDALDRNDDRTAQFATLLSGWPAGSGLPPVTLRLTDFGNPNVTAAVGRAELARAIIDGIGGDKAALIELTAELTDR